MLVWHLLKNLRDMRTSRSANNLACRFCRPGDSTLLLLTLLLDLSGLRRREVRSADLTLSRVIGIIRRGCLISGILLSQLDPNGLRRHGARGTASLRFSRLIGTFHRRYIAFLIAFFLTLLPLFIFCELPLPLLQ